MNFYWYICYKLLISMVFVQPDIVVFGIKICEPVTTATDLLVTVICWYAFFKLRKISSNTSLHYYLRLYFLLMGLATFIGGIIGHGFLYLFKSDLNEFNGVSPWKLPAWYISMISIALLERAVIERAKKFINPMTGNFFSYLNVVELLTFATITTITLDFFFVEVHSAYGLLIVTMSFSFFVYRKAKEQGSKLFLIAVTISAISALIFMNKWGLCVWFNHFDISHTLMALSAYVFYKGADWMVRNPHPIK